MRVGIFTDAYTPAISGVVTSIKMLASGLRLLGHEVYIFTTESTQEYIENDELEKKYVVRFKGLNLPFKGLSGYRFSFKLNRKANWIKKRYKLDLFHIQTEFSMGKLGIKAAKKLNIPCVYTFHTMYEEYLPYISKSIDKHFHNSFFAVLKKIFIAPLNKAAKIKIVPTRKVYSHLENYMLTGDIRIVPTGLELENFQNDLSDSEKNKLREKYGINKDVFTFLFLGRLSNEKSVDIIIHAFSKSQKGKNSRLLIVGDGPAMQDLKDLVMKLQMQDQIIFTGFIEWKEIAKYYRIADIFVNASKSETQGLTYVEALASSLPVLVQEDECLDGVVIEDYNGFLFDGEIELAEKMISVMKEQEKVQRLKENCPKSVEKFSKMCYAYNVEKVYLDALSK